MASSGETAASTLQSRILLLENELVGVQESNAAAAERAKQALDGATARAKAAER
jgi:hypothetical protein